MLLGLNGGILSGLLGVGGSAIAIALMVIVLDDQPGALAGHRAPRDHPDRDRGGDGAPPPGEPRRRASGSRTGLVGMAGAVPGALIAFALPVEALRSAFGALLIFGSVRTLLAMRAGRRAAAAAPGLASPPAC